MTAQSSYASEKRRPVELHKILEQYITHILTTTTGAKILFVDDITLKIISTVYPRCQLLIHEVYHVTNIDATQSLISTTLKTPVSQRHFTAIFLIEPTPQHILFICSALQSIIFRAYMIHCTSPLDFTQIDQLAHSDKARRIAKIEYNYMNFIALSPYTFTNAIPSCQSLIADNSQMSAYNTCIVDRIISGLVSVSLNIKKGYPSHIYYQASSDLSLSIAHKFKQAISSAVANFDSSTAHISNDARETIVILFDRRIDPVTPLLNQWTYEAMVHEIFGLNDNCLTIKHPSQDHADAVSPETYLFCPFTDRFLEEKRFSLFGELGPAIQAEMNLLCQTQKSNKPSGESIYNSLECYRDRNLKTQAISKHFKIVHELSQAIQSRHLFKVSSLEQEIACYHRPKQHLRMMLDLFETEPGLPHFEALRLMLLYHLRYSEDYAEGKISPLEPHLSQIDQCALVDKLKTYCLHAERSEYAGLLSKNVFMNKSAHSSILQIAKNAISGRQPDFEEETVYTQYRSYLGRLMDAFVNHDFRFGDSSEFTSLAVGESPSKSSISSSNRYLIIYVLGGACYKESYDLHKLMSSSKVNIIFGGTTFHQSKTFLADISISKLSALTGSIAPQPKLHHPVDFETEMEMKSQFIREGW